MWEYRQGESYLLLTKYPSKKKCIVPLSNVGYAEDQDNCTMIFLKDLKKEFITVVENSEKIFDSLNKG